MPDIPAENFSQPWPDASRVEPSRVADERETLTAFLDWHRATFALKCEGVAQRQMSERVIPPSGLSLHGLLRHLAAVERWWFRQQFAGEDVANLYYSDDDPDQDFDSLDGDIEQAFGVWRDECDESRRIVAAADWLDQRGAVPSRNGPFTLRWVLVQMIAEYARHNGHADLLRERIDGASGY